VARKPKDHRPPDPPDDSAESVERDPVLAALARHGTLQVELAGAVGALEHAAAGKVSGARATAARRAHRVARLLQSFVGDLLDPEHSDAAVAKMIEGADHLLAASMGSRDLDSFALVELIRMAQETAAHPARAEAALGYFAHRYPDHARTIALADVEAAAYAWGDSAKVRWNAIADLAQRARFATSPEALRKLWERFHV
jgi:hypothetical protein